MKNLKKIVKLAIGKILNRVMNLSSFKVQFHEVETRLHQVETQLHQVGVQFDKLEAQIYRVSEENKLFRSEVLQKVEENEQKYLIQAQRSDKIDTDLQTLRHRVDATKPYLDLILEGYRDENLDPTISPPPAYGFYRAIEIYEYAFRRTFEYIHGTGLGDRNILEFGTYQGFTARMICLLMRQYQSKAHLYLYDSFKGLPEINSPVDLNSYEVSVNKVWFQGAMVLPDNIDQVIKTSLAKIISEEQLTVVKGFFEDTSNNLPTQPKASLVHIDCDLYSSTKHVLENLVHKKIIGDGTVLMLDDFNCNRANPEQGERKAVSDVFNLPDCPFYYSDFFSYGWSGRALFIHEK